MLNPSRGSLPPETQTMARLYIIQMYIKEQRTLPTHPPKEFQVDRRTPPLQALTTHMGVATLHPSRLTRKHTCITTPGPPPRRCQATGDRVAPLHRTRDPAREVHMPCTRPTSRGSGINGHSWACGRTQQIGGGGVHRFKNATFHIRIQTIRDALRQAKAVHQSKSPTRFRFK